MGQSSSVNSGVVTSSRFSSQSWKTEQRYISEGVQRSRPSRVLSHWTGLPQILCGAMCPASRRSVLEQSVPPRELDRGILVFSARKKDQDLRGNSEKCFQDIDWHRCWRDSAGFSSGIHQISDRWFEPCSMFYFEMTD